MKFGRRRKKMSDVWWDAHLADKGVNALTRARAAQGDVWCENYVEKYNEAAIRTNARRTLRKK